jgi:hypothetical protein
VYVVHGTRKFLERVGAPAGAKAGDPTTVLGDWYATVLFWKRQVGLFVNGSTLLPVLLPFAPAATIVVRFPTALATVLRRHSIGQAFIEAECAAMAHHRLATTKNRSVVGMMTEFAFLAGAYASPRSRWTSWICRCRLPGRRADRCTGATAVQTENWLPTLPNDSPDCCPRGQDRGRRDEGDPSSYDLGTAYVQGGPMVDRVVMSHADDGLSFIADACAVMADGVNETRLVTASHADLVEAYAEMVVAFARLVRPRLLDEGATVRVAVTDHLLDRLVQARTGLIALPVLDIVDQLRGELTRDHVRV